VKVIWQRILEERMVYVYVDLCALKIFMAQDFFDVNRVFCLVVFHRAFPVSEGVEVDLQYSLGA